MENVNKNWVLGRSLVFGDKEQIAELARLKSIKDAKDLQLKNGLDLDDVDIEVERVCTSTIRFKCFKCESILSIEIEEVDMEEDSGLDDDNDFCNCRKCGSEYILKDNIIYLHK